MVPEYVRNSMAFKLCSDMIARLQSLVKEHQVVAHANCRHTEFLRISSYLDSLAAAASVVSAFLRKAFVWIRESSTLLVVGHYFYFAPRTEDRPV
jgi:hypothetical protein